MGGSPLGFGSGFFCIFSDKGLFLDVFVEINDFFVQWKGSVYVGVACSPQALFLRDLVPRPGTNRFKGYRGTEWTNAYSQIFGICLSKNEFQSLLGKATDNFSIPPLTLVPVPDTTHPYLLTA